jgi:hypothetical protein
VSQTLHFASYWYFHDTEKEVAPDSGILSHFVLLHSVERIVDNFCQYKWILRNTYLVNKNFLLMKLDDERRVKFPVVGYFVNMIMPNLRFMVMVKV